MNFFLIIFQYLRLASFRTPLEKVYFGPSETSMMNYFAKIS